MDVQPKIKPRLEKLVGPSLPADEPARLAIAVKGSERAEGTLASRKMYILVLTDARIHVVQLSDKSTVAVCPLSSVSIGEVKQRWWSMFTEFKLQLPDRAEPLVLKAERTARSDLDYLANRVSSASA